MTKNRALGDILHNAALNTLYINVVEAKFLHKILHKLCRSYADSRRELDDNKKSPLFSGLLCGR